MTIKTVLRMGDPCLLQVAALVTKFNTPELHSLIKDLEDTMQHLNGAGIAAPQIGVGLRVVIFGKNNSDDQKNPRYPNASSVPYTVLINPELTIINEKMESDWEGCLSVPGMRGVVPRYVELKYTGFDHYGNSIERIVNGFHARVVQHECDHLDGVLYPMRITNLKYFGFTDVFFPNQDVQDD